VGVPAVSGACVAQHFPSPFPPPSPPLTLVVVLMSPSVAYVPLRPSFGSFGEGVATAPLLSMAPPLLQVLLIIPVTLRVCYAVALHPVLGQLLRTIFAVMSDLMVFAVVFVVNWCAAPSLYPAPSSVLTLLPVSALHLPRGRGSHRVGKCREEGGLSSRLRDRRLRHLPGNVDADPGRLCMCVRSVLCAPFSFRVAFVVVYQLLFSDAPSGQFTTIEVRGVVV
jgi:hypothetical protein